MELIIYLQVIVNSTDEAKIITNAIKAKLTDYSDVKITASVAEQIKVE